MKAEQFCYWLQGHFELSKEKELNEEQVAEIKKHLSMVFYYDLDKQPTKEEQFVLNQMHDHKNNIDKKDVLYRC